MNKLLTSFILFSIITLGGQAQKKENYYVKHVEFPLNATLEQKIDMAARLVPTPQQVVWQQMELTEMERKTPISLILQNWMQNNG